MSRKFLLLLVAVPLVAPAPAPAHAGPKVVKRAKKEVRRYVRAVHPGARSIGLGVDVRDPLNHAVVLSGSFMRPNGQRCVITQATLRHARLLTYSDCLGGIA